MVEAAIEEVMEVTADTVTSGADMEAEAVTEEAIMAAVSEEAVMVASMVEGR